MIKLECERRIAEYQKNVEADLIDWGPLTDTIKDHEKELSSSVNSDSPERKSSYIMQIQKMRLLEINNKRFLKDNAVL